ncbi:META domain-containing protein [Flavobacterium lindanitolerans]|uniref:META domain-containing protein n=1 Tax=Flavobacterium lindanitolerans TaxID=428988 RepID=UPI002806C36A|nr:META domain-containing protein [Flavobacterium lindanitolerans]MDQ7960682.1 META domain-containing protein [Flavobacterium lindanitolerans]
MKKNILIIALAFAAFACNKKEENKTEESVTTEEVQPAAAATIDLFDKEWKLEELNGKAIKLDTTFKKEPLMVFQKGTGKLTGNGGCNNFSGSYKLKDTDGIELSEGGATMMACPNLGIEGEFFKVFKQVKSYRIENNSLMLDNEKKEVVAKLVTGK